MTAFVAVSTTARRTPLAALRLPRALRAIAWPLLASRLVVWGAGVPAMLALGTSSSGWRARADPTNLTAGLGSVGEVVGAPVMRWDSVYYVEIARHGYTQLKQAGFFPLYPLLTGALDGIVGSTVVAGTLISLVAFAVGLVLFDRLAVLETGSSLVARRAVWLLALFPASLFFSAVYTEGLFLALSVGAFLAARNGRWAWAGILGGLAAGHLGGAVNKGALFVVCAGALAIAVASFKRLPAAYGAYAIAALGPALSTPRDIGPLNGSIRYVAVVFPLFLWLALVLQRRRRAYLALCALFALGLAYCSVRFATWRWVA